MKMLLPALVAALAGGGCVSSSYVETTSQGVVSSGEVNARDVRVSIIEAHEYKGWKDAWLLANGDVWAAVVPSVGRVMQFGFLNDPGVFWENPKLLGQPMPEKPWDVTGSFGGDKTWPAPQSVWNWPPPDAFDREACTAKREGNAVVLTSPVSARFGIRTVRRVELERNQPVMRITTTYHKVQGDPVEVSVWVITQAKNPVATYLPVPPGSIFAQGHSSQWSVPTGFLSHQGAQLRFTRDPVESHKIGNDADWIVWQGTTQTLTVESPRIAGATYPDGGCSMEIYTNGGAVDYVELETLGPLKRLAVGDTLSATNLYRLSKK